MLIRRAAPEVPPLRHPPAPAVVAGGYGIAASLQGGELPAATRRMGSGTGRVAGSLMELIPETPRRQEKSAASVSVSAPSHVPISVSSSRPSGGGSSVG